MQIKENIKALRHWPLWGDQSMVNSPHKKPVTRLMFPFDDVIMSEANTQIAKEISWDLIGHFKWCHNVQRWHNIDITLVTRHFKSPETQFFVQQIIWSNNKEKHQSSAFMHFRFHPWCDHDLFIFLTKHGGQNIKYYMESRAFLLFSFKNQICNASSLGYA